MIDSNKCKAVYTLNKAILDAINDALLSDDCKTFENRNYTNGTNVAHRGQLEMMRKDCCNYQGILLNMLQDLKEYEQSKIILDRDNFVVNEC